MTGLLIRHLLIPAVAPASIVALYFTPVQVFGCVNRGLIALAVTGLALAAAAVTTTAGVRARARRDDRHQLWVLSTLTLLLTGALLIGLG